MDFGLTLKDKVFPVMLNELDFTSPEVFINSWGTALAESKTFAMVVHLLVANATSQVTSAMTIAGIAKLKCMIAKEWESEEKAQYVIYQVLGLSVVALAKAGNAR
jgi:hypothetical protein